MGRLSYISSTDNKETWEATQTHQKETITLQAGVNGKKAEELVDPRPNLEITVHKPVGFKVVVVLPEWIYQLFGHLRSKKQKRDQ